MSPEWTVEDNPVVSLRTPSPKPSLPPASLQVLLLLGPMLARSPASQRAALFYCCDQDHGEPSSQPSSAMPAQPTSARGAGVKTEAPSSSSSTPSPGSSSVESGAPPSTANTSSSSACLALGAPTCSIDDCDGVFDCCGLPLKSGCLPLSPFTGCEIADGQLECPDCRPPPGGCTEEFACTLAACEIGLIGCDSPECATDNIPCFDEECDEECGAVECSVDHAECPVDELAMASDVLDCCGHEHSWACQDAPPLFGDFDQLLECCPPQSLDFSPSAPVNLAASHSGTTTPQTSLFPSIGPNGTPQLSPSFQALLDAAVPNTPHGQDRAFVDGKPHQVPSPLSSGFAAATAANHSSPSQQIASQSTSPFSSTFSTNHGTVSAAEVPCLWTGCDEIFPNIDLLLDHFRTTASHIPIPSSSTFDQDCQAHLHAQQLFDVAVQQKSIQEQQLREQAQAASDQQATQDIIDFFNNQGPGPSSASAPPNIHQPQLDPFSVQCQWGAHPHTFTMSDLLPASAQTGQETGTLSDMTFSPTNLFLKHLMEDHLAGVGQPGLQLDTHPQATSPAIGDDVASVASGGLGSGDWSASSAAGTPTSLDGGFGNLLHHHHPGHGHFHHLHSHGHNHAHHYVPTSPNYLSPHSHSHVHAPFQPYPHPAHQHQHLSDCSHTPSAHYCSIEPPGPPPPVNSSTRPQASQARTIDNVRHHPYRNASTSSSTTTTNPSTSSSTSTSQKAHHAHHAHPHAHHHHIHHLHGRHLLPSVKRSSSTSSLPSALSALADVHRCGYPNCGLVFDNTDLLTDHMDKVHVGSGKKEYECGWEGCERAINGPIFKSKQKIMRHLQSHTGHKPFVCEICKQTFSEAATLQQHVRRHSKDKPHICDHDGCTKAFPLASSLAIHKRTHDEVKPFECPHCHRCFTEASNLNKHVRTHTGEKPFGCKYPGCGKRFARPDQLSRHQGVHVRKEERDRLAAAASAAEGSSMGAGRMETQNEDDDESESS